jgi:hypothetical protein
MGCWGGAPPGALCLAAVAVIARRSGRRRRTMAAALGSVAALRWPSGLRPAWKPLPFPELHFLRLQSSFAEVLSERR